MDETEKQFDAMLKAIDVFARSTLYLKMDRINALEDVKLHTDEWIAKLEKDD